MDTKQPEALRKTDTAARGTDAQIIKERELCAYAFAGAFADGLSGGTGPDTQESEWLRPAFEAGQEIAQLRAEIDQLRKRECLHQIAETAETMVRYCPGCGSIGPVDGQYRDCCPDGSEARMIPQALAKKCRDTFKLAIDSLLAQPKDAAPVAQAVPAEARQLHGDVRLAHDQCRAVVSLANSVAEVYAARAAIVEHDNSLANQIGQASAAAMEWLGDELNASDAATEEGEWLDPIFDAAQERWPQYAQAALAAVAVPTKVIEALEMLENGALNVAINAKNRGDGYDEGYANAMAKLARETLDALAAAPAGAPVVLSAPDAVLRFERSTAGKENEMPSVVSCNWLPDGEYKLYTEQQVRDLLMHRKLND